jgi:hypothetical protein
MALSSSRMIARRTAREETARHVQRRLRELELLD